jgi:hypothetical protein
MKVFGKSKGKTFAPVLPFARLQMRPQARLQAAVFGGSLPAAVIVVATLFFVSCGSADDMNILLPPPPPLSTMLIIR